jgi:hypothetical protein
VKQRARRRQLVARSHLATMIRRFQRMGELVQEAFVAFASGEKTARRAISDAMKQVVLETVIRPWVRGIVASLAPLAPAFNGSSATHDGAHKR